MGAPKQKWTAEEEAALKAGVLKHGAGKWRTILIDPEFSDTLHMRSNVDLKVCNWELWFLDGESMNARAQIFMKRYFSVYPTKMLSVVTISTLNNGQDKWRNINVTAIWGSRQKAKLAALKRNQLTPKHDPNPLAVSTVVKNDQEIVDVKPLVISLESVGSRERLKRLDILIQEAISNLKEPPGSDRAAIAAYIEDQYWAPPNLKKLLSAKLKHMIANGKLIKVKHRYRIPPNSKYSEGRKGVSRPALEGNKSSSPRLAKREVKIFTKSQIDEELSRMRTMSAQEAAAAAAKAVAEAEAAIAEAEEAAREAEAAEAEAEAAQVFARAAMNALNCRTLDQW